MTFGNSVKTLKNICPTFMGCSLCSPSRSRMIANEALRKQMWATEAYHRLLLRKMYEAQRAQPSQLKRPSVTPWRP